MALLKNSVITGGSAGIGKATAVLFAQRGFSVAIFGTNEQRSLDTIALMEQNRVSHEQKFIAKLLDVSNKQLVDIALKEVVAVLGSIDVLVNNAGITSDNLLMKMKEQDWDRVIAVNLKSVYNTCQAVIRGFLKNGGGKIINISSVVGINGNGGQTNYAASKAGIIGFTKALAKEVASRGICVNCVAPGFIITPMTDVLTDVQKESILKQIPMRRFGYSEEIASVVLFLASSSSNYITGQVVTVDGGMVM
jgi:3-oxoacyl-[acyl-carrier protein] reductase